MGGGGNLKREFTFILDLNNAIILGKFSKNSKNKIKLCFNKYLCVFVCVCVCNKDTYKLFCVKILRIKYAKLLLKKSGFNLVYLNQVHTQLDFKGWERLPRKQQSSRVISWGMGKGAEGGAADGGGQQGYKF